MSYSKIPRPKQDLNSPPASYKNSYVSQSSLLDSPIAQLLGFGTSSSQNISLPQIQNINSNSIKTCENVSSSNSNNFLNSQPTFSENKENNENKPNETKSHNIRLHNFQPPPLLLPKQNILQPQFIESPRTKNQEEFLEDFEFYPEESSGMNFNNSSSKANSSSIYSNLNSSPSPRTSTFDRSHASFDIVNKSRNNTNSDQIENPSVNRLSSSPTFVKNGFNRSSNKSIISLNLVNSPKLKPYMSSPFSTPSQTINANSTFSNKENDDNNNELDIKSSFLNDIPTPSPKTPTFSLSNFNDNSDHDVDKNEVSIAAQKFEGSKISSDFDSKTFLIDDIPGSRANNRNNNTGLPPIFTTASRSMLKIESDISTLKNLLNEVQSKYRRKYKSEKEKCRKEIIAMIERHREELNNYDESKNDSLYFNHSILPTSSKSSSRSKNKFRNSNRRIRHDDSNYGSSGNNALLFSKKQTTDMLKQPVFNIDSISLGPNSNKVINCIGTIPPPPSNLENVFSLPSTLKVSRSSGQPTIHEQSQPESVISVRVRIPNKKEIMHINDPKRMSLIKHQREEIIALNEETSLRLSSIIEEGLNAEKQINDQISELSASKNGPNYPNIVAFSDASSSSSSAPNAFCIDESDGSAKDEFNVIPASLLPHQTSVTSKYSSSSSSLSSSSFSSSSNLNSNTNVDRNNQSVNEKNKTKSNKQNIIPVCGKTRNPPQRLLRNIPH